MFCLHVFWCHRDLTFVYNLDERHTHGQGFFQDWHCPQLVSLVLINRLIRNIESATRGISPLFSMTFIGIEGWIDRMGLAPVVIDFHINENGAQMLEIVLPALGVDAIVLKP